MQGLAKIYYTYCSGCRLRSWWKGMDDDDTPIRENAVCYCKAMRKWRIGPCKLTHALFVKDPDEKEAFVKRSVAVR